MSANLKLGTLLCPHDKAPLHFEVLGSMRVKRPDDNGPGHVYQARCPTCGKHFNVNAPKEIDMDKEEAKLIKERAGLVKAFAAAKKYLSPTCIDTHGDGGVWQHEFICHCLNRARIRGNITATQENAAVRVIQDRLCGNCTLQSWMEEFHPNFTTDAENDRRHNAGKRMQQTRLAWLDSLIEEFSA